MWTVSLLAERIAKCQVDLCDGLEPLLEQLFRRSEMVVPGEHLSLLTNFVLAMVAISMLFSISTTSARIWSPEWLAREYSDFDRLELTKDQICENAPNFSRINTMSDINGSRMV